MLFVDVKNIGRLPHITKKNYVVSHQTLGFLKNEFLLVLILGKIY
jgi:hypothetical protein